MSGMQFGIFTVGDITQDPTTGHAPTEAERIRATVPIAKKAEEVGLDVFATGEHHNPPFVPSSPTTLLGYIAAQTERIILSTATTLITTNDPVKIAEDFSMPMFSYLHAVVSPTGVYAATDDFGAQHGSVGLSHRIRKAADDFARLLQACGPRTRRDVFAEELTEMEHLLEGWQPRDGGDNIED